LRLKRGAPRCSCREFVDAPIQESADPSGEGVVVEDHALIAGSVSVTVGSVRSRTRATRPRSRNRWSADVSTPHRPSPEDSPTSREDRAPRPPAVSRTTSGLGEFLRKPTIEGLKSGVSRGVSGLSRFSKRSIVVPSTRKRRGNTSRCAVRGTSDGMPAQRRMDVTRYGDELEAEQLRHERDAVPLASSSDMCSFLERSAFSRS